MALSMKGKIPPPKGPVKQRVFWGLSRGEKFATVRAATLKKVRGATIKAIRAAANAYRAIARAAAKVIGQRAAKLIGIADLPAFRPNPSVIRVTADIDVRMGDDSDFRTGRFIYDVPANMSRDDIIRSVFNQLVRDLFEKYAERKGGIRAVDSRIGGIQIVGLEAI